MELGNFIVPDVIPDIPRSRVLAPLTDMSCWSPLFDKLAGRIKTRVVDGYQFPLGAGAAEFVHRRNTKKRLLGKLKEGDIVYTLLRHRSASGMSRRISVFIVNGRKLEDITYAVSVLTGYKEHRKEQGLLVTGCGMDMGFAVVYDLSQALGIDLHREWL